MLYLVVKLTHDGISDIYYGGLDEAEARKHVRGDRRLFVLPVGKYRSSGYWLLDSKSFGFVDIR